MRKLICTSLLLAALSAPAQAEQQAPAAAPATAPTQVDAEEKFDNGLKSFGYLAGLARVCVSEAQKVALDREVLETHASIGRLFGTDRAFLFGSSFGYATSVKVDIKDCAEILESYEARISKQRAAGGKQP